MKLINELQGLYDKQVLQNQLWKHVKEKHEETFFVLKIGEILLALGYEIQPQRHCAKKAKIKSHLWRDGKHVLHKNKNDIYRHVHGILSRVHAANDIEINQMNAWN